MTVRTCLALLCAVAVTACATTGDEVDAAPDYSPIEALPVTDNGRLVIACLEQSLAANRYHRISDDENSGLIRFLCEGGPATAQFEALGPRSARIGSEFRIDGVVHRSSERIQDNLYGLDLCRAAAGGHECEINLNLGGFINE